MPIVQAGDLSGSVVKKYQGESPPGEAGKPGGLGLVLLRPDNTIDHSRALRRYGEELPSLKSFGVAVSSHLQGSINAVTFRLA